MFYKLTLHIKSRFCVFLYFLDETENHKKLEEEKDIEKHSMNCECGRHMFCTQTILEALRITLNSIIDLTDFLFDVGEYEFVLTAKFNQDCIEARTIR